MCRPKQFLSRQNVRCASGQTFFVTVSIFTRRDFHQTRQIVYKHMSALACIDSSLGLHAWIQRYRVSLVFLPRENNYGGRGLCVRHANTFWLLWRCFLTIMKMLELMIPPGTVLLSADTMQRFKGTVMLWWMACSVLGNDRVPKESVCICKWMEWLSYRLYWMTWWLSTGVENVWYNASSEICTDCCISISKGWCWDPNGGRLVFSPHLPWVGCLFEYYKVCKLKMCFIVWCGVSNNDLCQTLLSVWVRVS